jgi:hypothetical protein
MIGRSGGVLGVIRPQTVGPVTVAGLKGIKGLPSTPGIVVNDRAKPA